MSLRDIKDSWVNQMMSKLLKRRAPSQDIQNHLEDRSKICLECPHLKGHNLIKSTGVVRYCEKCSCLFPSLIFAYRKACPEGKWDAIPDDVT